MWNNLPGGEKEQVDLIKIQEDIYTTSFSQLSQQLLKGRTQIDAYRNKKITDSDCQKLLNAREINYINNYHRTVFDSLKAFMNKDELAFLETQCSPI